MKLFERKPAITREWEKLMEQEIRYINKRIEKKDNILNQKLEEKVPAKLQETLDTAFAKAFGLIFEKGTGVIEKTYQRDKLEEEYKVRQYAADLRENRKNLKAFTKKAKSAGNKNLLLSSASGVGMGFFGIGIPDIPVFTGLILKNIYEIALNYGYDYKDEQERYFILKIVQGALSYGDELMEINQDIDTYIDTKELPEGYDEIAEIEKTANILSKELLYMKFLQGIPVVGAIGGVYDAVYMTKISEYAGLKYKHRYLKGRM